MPPSHPPSDARRLATGAAALAAWACLAVGGCGDGDGGRVQRAEILQRCLAQKKLPTNLTREARLPGAPEPAELLDTELISPSAARLYVFASVDAAKSAAAAAAEDVDRRDNVVIVYAGQPTAADGDALDDCFSGKL